MAKRLPHQNTSAVRNKAEESLLKKIGRKVYQDIHDRQKSIEWLSFESDVSRATIRHIFNADRNIGILIYDRVARALGYSDLFEMIRKMS